MLSTEYKQNSIISLCGKPYRRRVILADANIPYKLSVSRNTNNLFFCVNADEFSDQNFHSAFVGLDTGVTFVVPGIRNGFASAVDNSTGCVYLGGSDGIYKFNNNLNDVETPPLIRGIDIFDMHFHKFLYFVDTASQNLFVYRDGKNSVIPEVKGCLIHHFVMNSNDDLLFISSTGLYILPRGAKSPTLWEIIPLNLNFRGMTTDVMGKCYIIAWNGVYFIDEESKQLDWMLPLENGYGLAFDKNNNMVYSEERNVSMLVPLGKSSEHSLECVS